MGPVFRGIRKHPPLYQGLSEADGNAQGFALVETDLFCRQGKKKLSVCVVFGRHRVLPRQSTTGEWLVGWGSKVCYGYNDPSGNMCNFDKCHICSACSKNGQVYKKGSWDSCLAVDHLVIIIT